MVYKCKICGGQTTVDFENGIAVCEYCGSKQALPLFTDKSAQQLYERGNSYLAQSEYDKAEAIYSQLLSITPNDPELYWDLVLCKFGVTYVKDPKSNTYIPTCNRTYYSSIFDDKNYKRALELSSGEKLELYQSDANTINEIQKGIISVSKKEKPFDIFISYKETDSNGNRTEDSVVAQDLYEKLTSAGYKVFFSRITLEDKIGTQYEPYIYAALYSSKVMITVCSSKENIEAVWVKNEWSRFLMLRQSHNEKTLIPLFYNMEKSELPEEFSMLSSYNIKANGVEQELLRGIKKLIPLPILLAQRRKKIKKTVGILAATLGSIAVVLTAIFLPKYLKALKYEEKYSNAVNLFENAKYEEAASLFKELDGYKNSNEMIKKCSIQPDYDKAMNLYYDGNYAESAWAFRDLGDYEDAKKQQKKAELSWRKSLSTVATTVENGSQGLGSYYINSNGVVDNFIFDRGNGHDAVNINKNGKIISIPSGPQVSLREDGTVDNIDTYIKDSSSSEWHDLIQISHDIGGEIVGLRADGKILRTNSKNEYNVGLEKLSELSQIVSFDIDFFYFDMADTIGGIISTVDSNGNASLIPFAPSKEDIQVNINKFNSTFRNVKKIDVYISPYSHNVSEIKAMAITNDSKIITYNNGTINTYSNSNIVDVNFNCQGLAMELHSDGKLYKFNSNTLLLSDVCALNNDFIVCKTGNVYGWYLKNHTTFEFSETEAKCPVYDEWIERLN